MLVAAVGCSSCCGCTASCHVDIVPVPLVAAVGCCVAVAVDVVNCCFFRCRWRLS